jgi:zinc/manganese transport system permease protein
MTLNMDGLDIGILGPACVAGLIVLSTHVPLGKQVLSRGIIFIDLAIAQIAGLGVILAQYLGIDEHGLGVQAAAAAAALGGAGLLAWTDRRWPEYQEPLIGTLFVLAATGGLLLLANNPQGGEHLKDLLVGQILWVNYAQLIPAAVLSVALLGFMWMRRGRLAGLLFYGLFALAITASVQLVGVYLVFTTLIVPAVATYRHAQGRQLLYGYLLAIGSYVVGLGVSLITDLPSSPVIVWAMGVLGLVVHLTGRRRVAAAAEAPAHRHAEAGRTG